MSCCGGLKPLSGVSPPAPVTPLTIMGSHLIAWYRADLLVLNGSTVSTWTDQSGNGFDLIQATAANQPTFNASDGPNSTPTVLFDGINDSLANATLNLPAPGTTPTFYSGVFQGVSWSALDRLLGAGADADSLTLVQSGGPGNVQQSNAAGPSLGNVRNMASMLRVESYFSASASDYQKTGSGSQGGVNVGNNNPAAGFVLGAAANLSSFGNGKFCEFLILDVLPSPFEKAQLDTYWGGRYGAVVLV